MTASFGKLQNHTLELKEGLNIIQAPNETGKSTWCAFLLAMFYGINSRERERSGFIPDKIRYAPWSGSPMSGRLDCRVGDTDITLTRTTRRQTAPMTEFQAVYAGTGDPVPGLTGQNCGEALLGVSREVFERSAFIRQAGLPISQDSGLERRIASLITSGDEDTSYSETADALKKQLNRRRHNKTGQIPTLEAELQALQQQLSSTQQLETQLQISRTQAEHFALLEAELMTELAQHERWEAAEKRRALAEAKSAAQQAAQRAAALRQRIAEDRIPENDTIGRLRGALVNLETTRKAVERSRTERDDSAKALLRAEAAVSKSPFAPQSPEDARREVVSAIAPYTLHGKNLALPLIASLILGGIVFGLLSWQQISYAIAIPSGIGAALAVFLMIQLWLRSAHRKKQLNAAVKRFGTSDQAEISALLDTYIQLLDVQAAAQATADRCSASADTLYNTLSSNEQAILLEIRRFAPTAFDVSTADTLLRECAQRRKALTEAESTANETRMRYEFLKQQTLPAPETQEAISPPWRSRDLVVAELAETRANLAAARSNTDRLSGQLHAAGDPAVQRSTAAHLEEELAQLESEYAAIQLAMDALDCANTTLQNRFSPELGRRATEIFSELTENRYSSVVLDRAFHLSAEPQDTAIYRDAALLSAGTSDQLYLSTRLAICDLVLPPEHSVPVILDDALTNFDDQRCKIALQWLKTAAKNRQILLFTCHSREAAFLAGDSEVLIQQLTESI